MSLAECERRLMILAAQAWDGEVRWSDITEWAKNFIGSTASRHDEELHALFALSRFMYFSRRLTREMLKALYRDHFQVRVSADRAGSVAACRNARAADSAAAGHCANTSGSSHARRVAIRAAPVSADLAHRRDGNRGDRRCRAVSRLSGVACRQRRRCRSRQNAGSDCRGHW